MACTILWLAQADVDTGNRTRALVKEARGRIKRMEVVKGRGLMDCDRYSGS